MGVEISNNVSKKAAEDIRELEYKIQLFKDEKMPEDKFKAYRLTRGVYGQRQFGVQMFRTKLPYGKITPKQLVRLADVSEKYATGNLHLTTRQNIQLHYVKLDDSPKVWTELADVQVTAREACGNTVRNVTASATAGIDPEEPFDITPYAHATFEYFLRNPICQDMGRKIKIAFSSNEQDTAFAYFHDFGFIPRVRDGKRGFKVLVGGGLGAQSIIAPTAYEFLEEEKILPFMEAAIRVFDRYGERAKRFKARMKFLVREMGLEAWMELVKEELQSLANQTVAIETDDFPSAVPKATKDLPSINIEDQKKYKDWLATNVFEQKQKGFFGVYLKVLKGDIDHKIARKLAAIVEEVAADDMRVTVNQGLLLRFVREEALPYLYQKLDELNFANPGFDTILDITTCPGTDTCMLGVTNSMELAKVLEDVLKKEYEDLAHEKNIKIKMSGCMNSCGQHMAAQIGFHGSSIKVGDLVAPAMQVILGGGVDPDGAGNIGEKVIKLPTKRIPDVLRTILQDYEDNGTEGEYFNSYFRRQGKRYFYGILKELGDKETFRPEEFQDWGHTENFVPEIGVGECAGVMTDLVGGIIRDAEIKQEEAEAYKKEKLYPQAAYSAYTGFVIGAKALLLSKDIACNTQINIIKDFNEHLADQGSFSAQGKDFGELVLSIKANEPSQSFVEGYLNQLSHFLNEIKAYRERQRNEEGSEKDKEVIENYYKA